ncbi:MAG: hypothetical protein ABW133_15550 [Polyangiaceae bacterium]
MSSGVKVAAVVAGLLAVSVGGYLASTRVGGNPVAAKIDKAGKAQGASTLPSVKTNSARGMAICQKVEAAGIGSDCQSFEKMVKFRIPSAPDGSGAVLTFEDPVVYKMFFSSLAKENSDAAFGSAKARTVVILTGVPSAELQAKTKAVVDAL